MIIIYHVSFTSFIKNSVEATRSRPPARSGVGGRSPPTLIAHSDLSKFSVSLIWGNFCLALIQVRWRSRARPPKLTRPQASYMICYKCIMYHISHAIYHIPHGIYHMPYTKDRIQNTNYTLTANDPKQRGLENPSGSTLWGSTVSGYRFCFS